MIIDITGTVLIPGNQGIDCPEIGTHRDIECCCDECDYLQYCLDIEEIPTQKHTEPIMPPLAAWESPTV